LYLFDQTSEAGNVKYCTKLHARRGFGFGIDGRSYATAPTQVSIFSTPPAPAAKKYRRRPSAALLGKMCIGTEQMLMALSELW
jgi:hypothetical protein